MTVRLAFAAAAALGVWLFSVPALAQEDRQDSLESRHKSYASPQHFAIEVGFSPFSPNVDSDPSLHGCTPFADIFGTSPSVMVSGEFDWQALRIPHLGTLGPGAGIGTVSFSANAPYSGSGRTGGCVTGSGQASGEQTSLTLYPMTALAVFRADVFWKDVGVPLVPYAKAGLGTTIWQASNTLGTSNFGGSPGRGYTLGSQLVLGLSFNLNVFDPYAARNFDEEMGVNGTYLFAEWSYANMNGLWLQNNALRVGGAFWTFGIAWEF